MFRGLTVGDGSYLYHLLPQYEVEVVYTVNPHSDHGQGPSNHLRVFPPFSEASGR